MGMRCHPPAVPKAAACAGTRFPIPLSGLAFRCRVRGDGRLSRSTGPRPRPESSRPALVAGFGFSGVLGRSAPTDHRELVRQWKPVIVPAVATSPESGLSVSFRIAERRLPHRILIFHTPAQCRAARGLLNCSQQQLADRASVSVTTLRNFERGASELLRNNLQPSARSSSRRGSNCSMVMTAKACGEGPAGGTPLRRSPSRAA